MQMLPYGQIILSNTNANVQNDRMQMLLKIANANVKHMNVTLCSPNVDKG